MSRRLVVWRHGRTSWNVENRYQGQSDIPLDDAGMSQAAETAGVLAELDPAVLASSDLQRAVATMAPLADRVRLPVLLDKRLRETDGGAWEGLTSRQIRGQWTELNNQWRAGHDVPAGATGERGSVTGARVAAALQDVTDSLLDGQTAVVVSHGGALRMGVSCLLGLPVEQWRLLRGLQNTAWGVLVSTEEGWRLDTWNALAGPTRWGDFVPAVTGG